MEAFILRIVLIGAPGVGKGTQAKLISKHFNIPHLSTGDMFRENITNRTALGLHAEAYIKKGQLVPDDITTSLVKNTISRDNCKSGFLLDGFPRNLYQAKEFNLLLNKQIKKIDKVIFIDVEKEIIINRLSCRRICKECGSISQISNTSASDHVCKECGGILIQREDDKENVVLNRLSIYNNSIESMLDYYNAQGILHTVKGNESIETVFSNICSILEPVGDSAEIQNYI